MSTRYMSDDTITYYETLLKEEIKRTYGLYDPETVSKAEKFYQFINLDFKFTNLLYKVDKDFIYFYYKLICIRYLQIR